MHHRRRSHPAGATRWCSAIPGPGACHTQPGLRPKKWRRATISHRQQVQNVSANPVAFEGWHFTSMVMAFAIERPDQWHAVMTSNSFAKFPSVNHLQCLPQSKEEAPRATRIDLESQTACTGAILDIGTSPQPLEEPARPGHTPPSKSSLPRLHSRFFAAISRPSFAPEPSTSSPPGRMPTAERW